MFLCFHQYFDDDDQWPAIYNSKMVGRGEGNMILFHKEVELSDGRKQRGSERETIMSLND